MRVDVQLNDDELALLSGYNRSTTMGIKKPGELQRELLSDMENIEEKREVQAIPEEQGKKQGEDAATVKPKETASASEDEEEVKSAPVRVRSDFLSMLSAMAQPNTHEDKASEDYEAEDEDVGILPEDNEDEEDVSVLPDDDEDDEDGGVLPEDEDEEDVSTLPDDDAEYDEDDGIPPADDEDAEGESVASDKPTTGIPEQQDDGYSSELPEDDDDEEYSSELPADEEDSSELPEDEEDSSELPEDENDEEDSSVLPDDSEDDYSVLPDDEDDEEDAGILPDDDDDESSVLPEDNEEVEDEPTPVGIQETVPTALNVVEHPVSPSHKVQKSVHPVAHQPTATPAGYSAPSVSLYDFILNNGGSMLIEDVKKYYPIDEVKKALNLGKIYRFGNKVGV